MLDFTVRVNLGPRIEYSALAVLVLCLGPFAQHHLNLLLSYRKCGECYARCDWLLPMIFHSTGAETQTVTSRETCFLCLVQHDAQF